MDKIVIAYKSDYPDIPELVPDFMEFWKEKLSAVPKEFIDSARIEVEAVEEYGCSNLTILITYKRPETKEESKARIGMSKRASDQRKVRDLARLAELKAQYEQPHNEG